MDSTMVFALSIANLIVVRLIITVLLTVANYADKSKAKQEILHGGKEPGTTNEKFQPAKKSDMDLLAEGIARLEQRLQAVVDLTIKHERKLSGIQAKGALGERKLLALNLERSKDG